MRTRTDGGDERKLCVFGEISGVLRFDGVNRDGVIVCVLRF